MEVVVRKITPLNGSKTLPKELIFMILEYCLKPDVADGAVYQSYYRNFHKLAIKLMSVSNFFLACVDRIRIRHCKIVEAQIRQSKHILRKHRLRCAVANNVCTRWCLRCTGLRADRDALEVTFKHLEQLSQPIDNISGPLTPWEDQSDAVFLSSPGGDEDEESEYYLIDTDEENDPLPGETEEEN